MITRESDKALRYINQLDEARCNGRWQDVPELARKVEKHAPHRKCLALSARAEVQVSGQSSQRPTTASSTSSSLPSLIPPLLSAIEAETAYAQDAFQATTCLGWIHWALDEPNLAIVRLPRDISAAVQGLSDSGAALQDWTKVCIVKAAYLKGVSQERNGSSAEAFHTYSSILPYLSYLPSLTSVAPQFRLWTERLLTRLCLLWSGPSASRDPTSMDDGLRIFRVWDRLWEGRATAADTEQGSRTARRLVWRAYYDLLSSVVQRDLSTTSSVEASEKRALATLEPSQYGNTPASRLQLRAELNRVEVTYESLLLQETHFPKASERNEEIESWVEAVISNWRVLCGPGWRDEELGEGGKEAVARGVLDILYRAATKTFHSTQILRYLFTVHASLAEFDLAFKAYNSYVEIVTRTKDRAEKSGEEDTALDDDDTILRTAAEAIRLLCRFGNRKEAGKAIDISKNIQKWLRQQSPASAQKRDDDVKDTQAATETALSPEAMAVAYRAIGISQAHWARLTYDIASRPTLQAQAAQSFRKALEPSGAEAQQLETLYCLGLLLAETRDTAGAIRVVKQALTSSPQLDALMTADGVVSEGSAGRPSSTYSRERRLISLWHLLALLLSARSEFDTASEACEAALDQFGEPTHLFGNLDEPHQFHNGYPNHIPSHSVEEKVQKFQYGGLVDQMEPFEREGIIQLKLTQLALVEALEGSNAAVDGSDELLALYARLFGDAKAGAARQQTHPSSLPPPRGATSSVRSSIFGRHSTKSAQRNESNTTSLPRTSTTSGPPENPPAPAIQITDEHGGTNGHHHHSVFRHKSHRDQDIQRGTGSLKLKKKSTGSLRERDDEASAEPPSDLSAQQGVQGRSATQDGEVADEFVRPSAADPIGGLQRPTVESPERPLRPIAHNVPRHAQPLPVRHARQPPRQDTRLPTPLPLAGYSSPDPRFPSAQERRHKISLLIKVWLFIAGLYTRAAMFNDASGAVDEAFKLADGFELELAHESSSSRAFADKGWGGGQSVEQLWADVWTQRGELALAQTSPHHALNCFEKALAHYPHHPAATVGLSNILLDVYCQKVPAEPPETAVAAIPSASASPSLTPTTFVPIPPSPPPEQQPSASSSNSSSPEELNRLAARDRAYGLLSSLTKLGSGWDYTEAWFALARAYEEGGQIEKAKEILWWCVELEDTRPIRSWHSVGMGGYVL